MDFKNKIILITGASSGIGKESVIEFVRLGANIILVARKKDKLEQVANELKNSMYQHWFVNAMFPKKIKLKKCQKWF